MRFKKIRFELNLIYNEILNMRSSLSDCEYLSNCEDNFLRIDKILLCNMFCAHPINKEIFFKY